ncbi:hypothetical protein ACCAA_670135 [Candidatus Accumulibacter aalborgensis]|uniref:Uncharacterized protein n=1 Tax=Candidatus Accumulibacter aalborgensis TaxID=1860102 RepID=A0A1A8XX80_9PROT|nr:hypothetical protein ACCAA_670135 [Candidatus Accumulibacter aalborgensis]
MRHYPVICLSASLVGWILGYMNRNALSPGNNPSGNGAVPNIRTSRCSCRPRRSARFRDVRHSGFCLRITHQRSRLQICNFSVSFL